MPSILIRISQPHDVVDDDVTLQVPHYRRSTVKNGSGLRPSTTSRVTPATDELERRRRLLEARNRYHSEPDLIQATAAAVDEEPMRHTPRLTSPSQSVSSSTTRLDNRTFANYKLEITSSACCC